MAYQPFKGMSIKFSTNQNFLFLKILQTIKITNITPKDSTILTNKSFTKSVNCLYLPSKVIFRDHRNVLSVTNMS